MDAIDDADEAIRGIARSHPSLAILGAEEVQESITLLVGPSANGKWPIYDEVSESRP